MSARYCGCDFEAAWPCSRFPECDYGVELAEEDLMAKAPTTEIYADTRGISTCTGKTCGRSILWATVVKSGKRMCFDDLELVALATRHEPDTHRVIERVPLERNHWATCADRAQFTRRG